MRPPGCMKRFVPVILFFTVGTVLFAVAFYAYRSYQNYIAAFACYGVPEKDYLNTPEFAEVFFNFKYGVAKYCLLGLVSWALGIFFLLKKSKDNEQKNY